MQGGGPSGIDTVLQLPGGITTSRRSALKTLALAGGLGSFYVLLTRTKVSFWGSPSPILMHLFILSPCIPIYTRIILERV